MGMLEEKLKKIIEDAYENAYNDGYIAGYKARELEENKDEQRRLGQVYTFGYQLGAEDAYAKYGVVEIDELDEAVKEFEDLQEEENDN